MHTAGVAAEQRRRDADAAFQAERESLGAEVRTPPKTGVSRLRRATRIDLRGAAQARDARDAAAEAWQRSEDQAEEVEEAPPPFPSPLVLSGHAASFTPY